MAELYNIFRVSACLCNRSKPLLRRHNGRFGRHHRGTCSCAA